jgi:hypothetical protein
MLIYPAADDAAQSLSGVYDLQKQRLITPHEAAIVSWPNEAFGHE